MFTYAYLRPSWNFGAGGGAAAGACGAGFCVAGAGAAGFCVAGAGLRGRLGIRDTGSQHDAERQNDGKHSHSTRSFLRDVTANDFTRPSNAK